MSDPHITAVTCVKNEGPFLIEWIAFHRLLGVRDFLFYSNDCTDGTDHLLDTLAGHGIVTHLPNPAQNRNYQMQALKAARAHPLVRAADWVWIADVDEFPNIHVGHHRFADLIAASGDAQVISLHFQFMANGGVEDYQDLPVTEQFLTTHNPDIWCTQTAIEVKTLIRQDFPTAYFGAHRPFHDLEADKPDWRDGAARTVPGPFLRYANKRRIRAFPAKGARLHATLNHYALRSLDSYLVKNDRGDVNRENRAFDDSYWRDRNDGSHFDDSILRYSDDLAAEMAALKRLPGVADRHDQAVAAHRAKRDALLAQDVYQQMRAKLRSAPRISAPESALIEELGL